MSGLHVFRVPTHIVSSGYDGTRWCFYCRKRVPFTFTVHAPDATFSNYGPHVSIECEQGHFNGDCFPGSR